MCKNVEDVFFTFEVFFFLFFCVVLNEEVLIHTYSCINSPTVKNGIPESPHFFVAVWKPALEELVQLSFVLDKLITGSSFPELWIRGQNIVAPQFSN